MKTLVKRKFHLMTLFIAVLLTVGTATSDDQIDVSTETTKQIEKNRRS